MSNDTDQIPWTTFWDMHSGGGTKEGSYDKIYIQASQSDAEVIFFNRFGHSPDRVSCTCCGPDYSIDEHATLTEATAYHRGCAYDSDAKGYVERPAERTALTGDYRTVEEYAAEETVLVINADEIKPEERAGTVPSQGYVWVD